MGGHDRARPESRARGRQHLAGPRRPVAGPRRRRPGSRRASAPCGGRRRRPARSPTSRPVRRRAPSDRSSRVRIVVAPSRCLQNDAKSCAPEQRRRRLVHRVEVERPRPGQHVAAASAGRRPRVGRRSGRRSAARAPRSGRRSPSGAATTRRTRTSAGRRPLSRRRSGSVDARAARRRRRRATTWPRAWTPVSVRPAQVTRDLGHPEHRRERGLELALRRCAARAAWPSRGSRCRRRRGRSAAARRAVSHCGLRH